MREGQRVTIVAPGNDRMHGTEARVKIVTPYGAVLDAPAAATGSFRVLPDEVRVIEPPKSSKPDKGKAREQGYTGDECQVCKGVRMRRNGACLLCEECGTTSGCS